MVSGTGCRCVLGLEAPLLVGPLLGVVAELARGDQGLIERQGACLSNLGGSIVGVSLA